MLNKLFFKIFNSIKKRFRFLLLLFVHEKDKKNPWREISSLSKKVRFLSWIILLLTSANTLVILVVFFTNYLQVRWDWFIVFGVLITSIFGLLIWHRFRGMQLYRQFLIEIEERLAKGRSTRVPEDKSLVLKNYLQYSNFKLLKVSFIIFGLGFIIVIAPNDIVQLIYNPYSPEKVLEAKMKQTNLHILQLQVGIENARKSIEDLERVTSHHQQKIQNVEKAFYENYSELTQVKGYINKISTLKQNQNPAFIEQTSPDIMEQVRGMLALHIWEWGDDEMIAYEQAKKNSYQPEKVSEALNDLSSRYNRLLRKMQDASYNDQLQMQESKKLIHKNDSALQIMRQALEYDELLLGQLQKQVREDSTMWERLR